MRTLAKTGLLAGISLLASAAPAFAQEAASASNGNDEIIVTAQRRVEKVTDVPISISVASSAQLERQQVNTINDLNRISASLEIMQPPGQNTGGGGMIRGVGTQTFAAGAAASVGVIVDQVSQGNANIGDLFDIARVEVLKGPQGTLFGLTTSAGAINITTNAPDPTRFSGKFRTELSDAGTAGSKFGNQVFQGVVNLPLASNAALRVSGVVNLRQGVNYNLSTKDYAHTDRYVLRGRLLWEPSDTVTVNLIGDFNRSLSTYGGDFFTYTAVPSSIAADVASCGIVPGVGNQDICTTLDPHSESRNYGGSAQIDVKLGDHTLTSITALRRSENDPSGVSTINRIDPLHAQLYAGPTRGGTGSLFTQELRLTSPANSRFEYTAGLFTSMEKSHGEPSPFVIRIQVAPNFFITPVNDPGRTTDVKNKSWAAFGQGTFHIDDRLSVLGGLRYTENDLSLIQTPVGGTTSTAAQSVKVLSWKVGAQYKLGSASMVYATATRGFKGGQIAIPTGAAPVVLLPEKPMSYEIGYKTTLFGGWVLDANAFYQKFDNYQAQKCTINPTTTQLVCTQTNLPQIKSRGAEISVFGNVNKNLSISSGFIYAKTTYPDNFLGDDGTNIGDTQLAYAPRYKFTFSGEYNSPVSNSLEMFAAADAVWKSEVKYNANSVKLTEYPSHWMVGGRLGLRTENQKVSGGVFVRNLFNEHEPSMLLTNAGEVLAMYNPQSFRQVGLFLQAGF